MKRRQKAMIVAVVCGSMGAKAQRSLAEANRMFPAMMTHTVAESAEPATSLEDALHLMFAQADVVFAGTVTKLERTDGAVNVHFRVEDSIRGVLPGSDFTLREWSGLWADDMFRYVEGERRLMLLHAASSAGSASPVWGARGAIRMRGDVQPVVDLRWIAAEVNAAHPIVRAMSVSANPDAAPDNESVDAAVVTDLLHAWQRAEVTQ